MADAGFAGQGVIVTGGTRGIGAGIAGAFLAAGARVLVCGRSPAGTGPGAAEFVQADVRDPDQARLLVGAAMDRFGRVDVLVSNAGGSPPAPAATASPRFHAKVIELNLTAPLHVAQAANAVMQDQDGGGSIVMIGSVSGTRPSPGTAAYGAAKAGLHSLAASLAAEWAPRVRVNCVVPSLVQTEATTAGYAEAGLAEAAAAVPLGRLATPADVAAACLFLASPQAAYVSGAALLLHGGGERPAVLAALDNSVYPRSE